MQMITILIVVWSSCSSVSAFSRTGQSGKES